MILTLKADERELIRLANFFKKKVKVLVDTNKSKEDYTALIETCEKLIAQINLHAKMRDTILKERDQLKTLVKENALCPKCHKNGNLKLIGTDKTPEGWKSNKYRCKKCNIEFVWNAPNNPWDMIPYAEHVIADLDKKIQLEEGSEEEKQLIIIAIEQLKANLEKLKPVVEASDLDLLELETRDKEMGEIVSKFKKYLMIEKIKIQD
ncbi:MAG TPA: hypothetical protein VNW06_11320 [Cytophagaceae bacterium]|jgi:hypothetical protein|nr:hypothetical protein [Cytophagaceae bacterium]